MAKAGNSDVTGNVDRGFGRTPLAYQIEVLKRGFCPHCGERLTSTFERHLWLACPAGESTHEREDYKRHDDNGVLPPNVRAKFKEEARELRLETKGWGRVARELDNNPYTGRPFDPKTVMRWFDEDPLDRDLRKASPNELKEN